MSNASDPRYPIGTFTPTTTISPADRRAAIQTIAAMPERLREAVSGLDEEQRNTPYREGGWTVRQVVHHLADSQWQRGYKHSERGPSTIEAVTLLYAWHSLLHHVAHITQLRARQGW